MYCFGFKPDRKTPNKGVTITMSNNADGANCSLTVSVVCDPNGVRVRIFTDFKNL